MDVTATTDSIKIEIIFKFNLESRTSPYTLTLTLIP